MQLLLGLVHLWVLSLTLSLLDMLLLWLICSWLVITEVNLGFDLPLNSHNLTVGWHNYQLLTCNMCEACLWSEWWTIELNVWGGRQVFSSTHFLIARLHSLPWDLHCCHVPRRLLRHFVKKIPLFGEKTSLPIYLSKLGSKTNLLVKFSLQPCTV